MKWTKWVYIVVCLGWLPAVASAQNQPAAFGAPYGYQAYYPRAPYGYQGYPVGPYRQPAYAVPPACPYCQSTDQPYGCPPCPAVPAPTNPNPTNPNPTNPNPTNPNPTNPNPSNPNPTNPNPTNPETNPNPEPNPEANPEPGANPEPATPPQSNAQAPEAGTQSTASVAPQMLGDYLGTYGTSLLSIRSVLSDSSVSNYATTTDLAAISLPLLARGAYKISENESPYPTNRVFVNFNYYNNVPVSVGPTTSFLTLSPTANNAFFGPGPFPLRQTLSSTLQSAVAPGTAPTTPLTTLTDIQVRTMNVERETFGFEKTIGENCSIEIRVPLIQTGQPVGASVNTQRALAFQSPDAQNTGVVTDVADGGADSQLGDITVVVKYALACDPCTGDVCSTGVVVTAPTGQTFAPAAGGSDVNPVLLQPWLGFVRNGDRCYVQGFSSVVVPTDFRDATILFNDLGVGYRLYQGPCDACLTAITPTAEVHVTTPLTHVGAGSPFVSVSNAVDLTGGVHVDMGRARFTAGASVPVTGPQLFSVEGVAQFNLSF